MTTDQVSLIQNLNAYDDRFVNIDGATNTLTLKHYLLCKPTLKIHIPSLLYIRPASEVVKRMEIRSQGISLRGILWARDWHRGTVITGPGSGYEKSFVIKAQGDKLRRGFTVEDPERFLDVLEWVYPGIMEMAVDEYEDSEIQPETEREALEGGGLEAQPELHHS